MTWVWTLSDRDTFIVTLGNAITSILAGFAIFSVLGYMSQELGVPVDQVAKAGRWGVVFNKISIVQFYQ